MITREAETPVLRLAGLRKSYASGTTSVGVLDGVDLALGRGEVVAVAGRSGSGKTTLLSIITGWVPPDTGTVELAGRSVAGGPTWRDLAFVPQSLGLLDELTIAENVTFPVRLAPSATTDDPGALLARLGIDHLADRHPDEVSLGEQQRAALARAAIVRPQLLVADEPISHQNRAWADAMMALVGDLATQGTTCLLATHDELAFGGADRVLELCDGRLSPRSEEGRAGN